MNHQTYMQRALELALGGLGRVEPNPMVGAVMVRDGRIIGEGRHRAFGEAHAEVQAIGSARLAGHDPRGATMYVTLEPCCHHGKTPPCVQAIREAGIAEIHVAMVDPFERVAGRGLAALRDAGLRVKVGLCESQARELNRPFIKRIEKGLPWIIAKWAQTLDGFIATATGHSQWISNAQSRKMVHHLRSRVDGIMVGIGTVLTDDPQLTARDVDVLRTARRIIIDPNLRIDLNAKLLQENESGRADPPVLIAVHEKLLHHRDAKLRTLQDRGVAFSVLPVESMLREMVTQYDMTNILVEGGPALIGSMLEENLIDELQVFIAPKLLGDDSARSAVAGFSRETINQATHLKLIETRQIEEDIWLRYAIPKD